MHMFPGAMHAHMFADGSQFLSLSSQLLVSVLVSMNAAQVHCQTGLMHLMKTITEHAACTHLAAALPEQLSLHCNIPEPAP